MSGRLTSNKFYWRVPNVCRCTRVCTHRKGLSVSTLVLFSCFGFETRSHIGLEFTKQARLAGLHTGPEIPSFEFDTCWNSGMWGFLLLLLFCCF